MIVKNGEILAIDHIAHDNTLSGNGTSAKPVGLSQSTNDLIDSKVKKTDFETYKSSAANQISNINTKITTDESNFNSYKSSAHNEIARVDSDIAAVNAAKVDNTTFTQYQTDVANSFTAVNKRITDVDAAKVDNTTFDNFKGSANGELTDIKQSITDLNNAKQAKGDYVSASDFNNLKSSAHDEIERIDGRIDATNTNLSNNYYDRTTIDKKFADFGGYKFREPDPNNNNQPILNQGEDPDPKAIYLTQPEGATQYLQWIWDEEITEENKWKCIGDTTMDLSDYAKTVDVVASANNNVNAVKNWTNDNFETISDFNTVIAGYYTKGQVDTVLENIAQEFVDTSAWANDTFATKTDLAGDKAELEGKINNLDTKVETELSAVSGKIIGELNSSEQALDERINSVIIDLGNVSSTLENEITDVDNKVDTLTDELHNDYYTSNQIDAILAASGEYYTVDEVNEKLEEYAKSTDLDPIKDDINSISAEFDNYYTSNQIDNKFVTNDDFNNLDEDVGLIDNDLDTLSGKTISIIKDSETVKAIRSTEPDGTISYTLSAHDGKQTDYLWKPTVNAAGDISWELALTGDTPATANIKGPEGIQGVSGTPGKDGEDGITPKLKIDENDIWNVSYDNEATWTSLGVSATGPKGETGAQGPQGIQGIQGVSGTPGKDGENGITPHIGDNNHWFIDNYDTGVSATGPQGPAGTNGTDGKDGVSPTVTVTNISANPLDPDHKNGGTEITITDATSTNKFSAWNGNDGTMAGAPDIKGKNGISAVLDGSTYEVGLSDVFYNAITSVSSTYAKKDALDDYLTKNDAAETYQPIGNYLSANALNGYATEAWVKEQSYLTQNDIAGKADKTELETVSGEIVDMIPSLNGYATEQYVQGASAEVTAWVNDHHYLVADDIAGKADKADLQYVSAGVDYVSGHIPTKVTDLTDSANYYTINQTSAANELTTEFAKYALLANVPTKVTDLTDSADYAKKTDLEEFVTSSNISTPDIDYVMTTTGWKVLTLPGGGMTQVIHDTTLSGQGNADDNKLGVAWSALSGYTIASALSAGSATVAANLGTSSFADITSAINAKADATAISDMLTKTEADQTYQTKAGMSDYLTTSDASTTYQQKGNYATTSDISDMATKTWVGQRSYLTQSDLASYATETYVDTASAAALSQAKTWVNQQNFATSAGLAANTRYEMTNTGWTSAIKIQVDTQVPTTDDGILHIILES